MFGQQTRNGLFRPATGTRAGACLFHLRGLCRKGRARDAKGPAMRHDATSSGSAPKPSGGRPRRRSVESDRTSDDGDDRSARSSVERVPPDERANDELGPQRGYGGSRPDENEPDR
jgi:hypothetical protein